MSAVMTQRLLAVLHAAEAAPHGQKGAIYQAACAELGISRQTLQAKLRRLRVSKPRKQRSDKGSTGLSRKEALLISGVWMESLRGAGGKKVMYSLADTVQALRVNNLVRAERIDKATGELVPMSEGAIIRALRMYGVHPEQLRAPAPHRTMVSEHPNQVWQIDASLCVLYYLKPGKGLANGLHVMKKDQFYKNKPANLARVMADRVWSYEITDHASGWIYVEYVMGAESGENLCNVFIHAMQERGGPDMLHGVPKILYMDPGSANTSAMTKNLCRSLGVQAIAHAPGNARATGQVEKARDIIERKFEAGLRFRPVADLDELNALAAQWRAGFNGTAVHSRHGMTRSAAWMSIRGDQLVKAPAVAICRELAVADPVERVVKSDMTISFNGDRYRVGDVPGVMVGEKVLITRNPWRDDTAQLVSVDAQGYEVFHILPRINKTTYGFPEVGGSTWNGYEGAPAHTPAQQALKEIEQLMTGTETSEAAEQARKAKAIPLGGKLDPFKGQREAVERQPDYLPRQGSAHPLTPPRVETPTLTPVQLARALRNRLEGMGQTWRPEMFAWIEQRYPEGAKEDELDAIAGAITQPQATALKLVGGQ